jgi:uncharacterized membrane protein
VLTYILDVNYIGALFYFPVLLFLPGFALVSFFYPTKDPNVERASFSDVVEHRRIPIASERLILAVFISLAISTMIQFYLITFDILTGEYFPTIVSITYLLFGAMSYLRSLQFPEEQIFSFRIEFDTPSFDSMDRISRVQFSVIIVALLFSIPSLQSIVTNQENGYSQIFILNSEGNANDYVSQISTDEVFSVITGVSNFEGESQEYRLQFSKKYYGLSSPYPSSPISIEFDSDIVFSLENEGQHQSEFPISLQEVGLWKLEFTINSDGPIDDQSRLGTVHLWVSASP